MQYLIIFFQIWHKLHNIFKVDAKCRTNLYKNVNTDIFIFESFVLYSISNYIIIYMYISRIIEEESMALLLGFNISLHQDILMESNLLKAPKTM